MLTTKDILLQAAKEYFRPLKYLFVNQVINHTGTSHFWGNILFFFSRTELLQTKKDGTTQSITKRYPVVYAFHITPLIAIGITLMKKDKP